MPSRPRQVRTVVREDARFYVERTCNENRGHPAAGRAPGAPSLQGRDEFAFRAQNRAGTNSSARTAAAVAYRGAGPTAGSRLAWGWTAASLSPSDHLIASDIMICRFRTSQASVLWDKEL